MDKKQAVYVVIILFLAFVYSFYFAPHPGIPDSFKNMHQTCLFGECSTDRCYKIADKRGESYILENDDKSEEMKKCTITWWNGVHFMMYVILTYLVPDMAIGFMLMGIGFEYYEYKVHDCGDYMDIIVNNMGILCGLWLSTNI